MRHDGVRHGGPQIGHRQSLENLVRETRGRRERQLERRRVGDAGAVEVARHDAALGAEARQLRRRPVDEHDTDAERPQDGDVEQNAREVLVGDDRAVNREDEGPLAVARDVLQDAAQVGRFHRALAFRRLNVRSVREDLARIQDAVRIEGLLDALHQRDRLRVELERAGTSPWRSRCRARR